jgi:hypothetical protein
VTWVSALLKRGACVTAGNVFEPYLGACLDYDIFYQNLLAGAQVGEAALAATPAVSWQGIVLGDPLYRPFPKKIRSGWDNPFALWQKLRRSAHDSLPALQAAVEQKMSSPNAPLFVEMFACLCMDQKQYSLAAEYFAEAARRHYREADKVRTALLQAAVTAAAGNTERALGLFGTLELRCAATPWLKSVQAVAAPYRPKPEPAPEKKKAP